MYVYTLGQRHADIHIRINAGDVSNVLLSWNPIQNLPPSVLHVNAERYVRFDAWQKLLAIPKENGRRHMQVLADILRAMYVFEYGGWIMDGDCVCCDRIPDVPLDDERLGHFFASMRRGAYVCLNAFGFVRAFVCVCVSAAKVEDIFVGQNSVS